MERHGGRLEPAFDLSTLTHLSEGYASGTVDQASTKVPGPRALVIWLVVQLCAMQLFGRAQTRQHHTLCTPEPHVTACVLEHCLQRLHCRRGQPSLRARCAPHRSPP